MFFFFFFFSSRRRHTRFKCDWSSDVCSSDLAVAERHRFDRVAVRTWFVLLPLARVRERDDLIGEASQFFATRMSTTPRSHYARVISTAAHLHFAALGLEPAFVPDVESRLPSFDLDHDGPSWLAAVETL